MITILVLAEQGETELTGRRNPANQQSGQYG